MKTVRHRLSGSAPGTTRELQTLHYGPAGSGRKAVIQASLHADEVPGLLVAHHLRERLAALEASGALAAEIVLVPFANPIGLSQWFLHAHQGRFDLASGLNFNRHYSGVFERARDLLLARHAADRLPTVVEVRAALREACAALPVTDELASLRQTLLSLAVDADVVLDLHCDNEAALHLYGAPHLWPAIEPLARLLEVEVTLLASESGDEPFDEACSTLWPRLAAALGQAWGRPVELPAACIAVTVELRGEVDVDHATAARDAEAIIGFLATQSLVRRPAASLPVLKREPRPLAGTIPVVAPKAGVLVYQRELGCDIRKGDRLADLVDPFDGSVTALVSPVDGVLFARERRRFVPAGARVAKVAGKEPIRSGKLLSA